MDIDLDSFMFIDKLYNIAVYTKHFKKQKNYDIVINHIYKLTDELIKIKTEKFNDKTITVYIDLKDYKIREVDYDFMKQMIKVLQEKYPDNLNHIYIKNATFVIKGIYAIIRPFIDKVTRKKIFFLKKGKNKDKDKSFNEEDLNKVFEN
tara:strand:- start:108 stop:554 length:447 start_codon:yes stop_codon:yes gene_type:complete